MLIGEKKSNLVPGRATAEGTQRYQERHRAICAPGHFREAHNLVASSLGIGTYLGRSDERTDALVTKAAIEAVMHGVNLIDSAINYREERAEQCVGQALRHLLNSKQVSRDELIICTKGGVLPYSGFNPEGWFSKHYVRLNSNISRSDLVAKRYCIHPEYLRDQLDRSLKNLGVQTIDIYYVHNPEIQLSAVTPDVFYSRLRAAFEFLEEAVAAGKIAAYGLATWQGFRVPSTSKQYLNLARIKALAREAAGGKEDKLRFIQIPFNLAMREALFFRNQHFEGEQISTLAAAKRLGIIPIASRSVFRGRSSGQIPENIASVFGDRLKTDSQKILQYARSTPGLMTALVGMKNPKHVRENLALTAVPPLDLDSFHKLDGLNLSVGMFASIRNRIANLLGMSANRTSPGTSPGSVPLQNIDLTHSNSKSP